MRRYHCLAFSFFSPSPIMEDLTERVVILGNKSPKYEFGSNSVVNVARRHEHVTKRRRRGREHRAQVAWHFDSDSSRFATFSCAFPEGNFVTRQPETLDHRFIASVAGFARTTFMVWESIDFFSLSPPFLKIKRFRTAVRSNWFSSLKYTTWFSYLLFLFLV